MSIDPDEVARLRIVPFQISTKIEKQLGQSRPVHKFGPILLNYPAQFCAQLVVELLQLLLQMLNSYNFIALLVSLLLSQPIILLLKPLQSTLE